MVRRSHTLSIMLWQQQSPTCLPGPWATSLPLDLALSTHSKLGNSHSRQQGQQQQRQQGQGQATTRAA